MDNIRDFYIETLGISAAEKWNDWDNQAFVLYAGDGKYLFDCGAEDVKDDEDYDAVFLTHYHIDHTRHIFDINAGTYIGPKITFFSEFPYRDGTTSQLTPEAVRHYLEDNDVNLEEFTTDRPSLVYSDRNIDVYTVPVRHVPVISATGYLVVDRPTGRKLWISGDFHDFISDETRSFVRRMHPDLSLIECTFYNGNPPDHQDYKRVMKNISDLEIDNYRFVHLSYRWEPHLDVIWDKIAFPYKKIDIR